MGRRSRRSWTRFHGWGFLLAAAVGFLAWRGAWGGAGLVSLIWLYYVLFARVTNCRVETVEGAPCSRDANGLLGTCRTHRSAKWRALPRVCRDGAFGLPRLMWPRPAPLPRGSARSGAPPPPPRPEPTGSAQERRERTMTFVGVAGLVVAILAFARDVIAG
jgi:hypothetical protein